MNALVEQNLDLVFAEAKGFIGDRYEEYVTSGYIGLTQAAQSWQTDMGASFRTHARRRINGAIRDQIRQEHGRKGRNSNVKFMDSFISVDQCRDNIGRMDSWDDFVSVQPIDQSTDEIDRAMDQLNERQREVARLRMLGTPIRGIAAALGLSEGMIALEMKAIKAALKARGGAR